MMKRLLFMAALSAAACDREAQKQEAAVPPAAPSALPFDEPRSKLPDLVPRPRDQAQLDRLILAGYTPHSDHLHAPGVNECPLTKGSDAVM